MRPLRPALLLVALGGFAALTHSQARPPRANQMLWGAGSPAPEDGGVGVTVLVAPARGWVCSDLTVRVVDDETSKTLGEDNYPSPPGTVTKSYANLGSGVKVRVTAMSTFQNGAAFEFKDLEAAVTTK